MDFTELKNEFMSKVFNNLEVDPDDLEHWYSLTYGWALAKGLSVEDAHKFARLIRYGD